ncbi:MAG TPA: sigma-70 family RNA polymerase sigma factor [Solirubrobacteraceae bacterium]|nr:sigma-70 family RNA polymerase sigma factor [Solirubrobacteraceae bacterium]
MLLVQQGVAGAFEPIFVRHRVGAMSLAFRICHNRAQAEDYVQEGFISAWRGRARYDPERGAVRSWVLMHVRSRAIDALRHERSRNGQNCSDESIAELASGMDTAVGTIRLDAQQALHLELTKLPVEQRRVIELAFWGDRTHNEIAAMLCLPAGTVKGRMRLGLKKLRRVDIERAVA